MNGVSFRIDHEKGIYALDMIKQILKTTTATAAAALFAASIGSAASASTTDEAPVAGEFNLTVESYDGSIQSHTINCLEQDGDSTAILNACSQLHDADGIIEDIPAAETACNLEFSPVTLTATGTWNGEVRTYSEEHSNLCHGVRDTGGFIFNFS